MRWLLLGGGLILTGCMNVTASLEPENLSVPERYESSDCVTTIFGLAYGRATFEGALAQESREVSIFSVDLAPHPRITKIRRISLHDYHFLFFGARCVEVVGE